MTVTVEVSEREFLPDTVPLATWWRQTTPGTFYWRCLIPARHLPGRVNALHWDDFALDSGGEPVLHRQAGTAIWQFLGNATRGLIAAHIQAQGTRVLMEVDDNYLSPPPRMPGTTSQWTTTLDRSEEDRYSHQAHRRLIEWMDGVIVSTPFLADLYAQHTQAPIFVCPNSVDPDDWEPVGERDRNVTVGYAGSDSHRYDLHLVERALDTAHRAGADLVKLGATTKQWRWPHHQEPWTNDLDLYRRSLQKIDIGLCPVRRSAWHDGKSDIKALEYVMAGAIPIVQADSPCYSEWVDLTFSASTAKQWDRAVKEALALNPDQRQSMWADLRRHVLLNKTIGSHIHKWREAIR